MIYKTIESERIVNIKCTLKEYKSKEFREIFNELVNQEPDQVIIKISLSNGE